MKKLLILSDGRPGHVNQSIAFAKYTKLPYDIINIVPKWKWSKALSYIFDKIRFYTDFLYDNLALDSKDYTAVIGAGSMTYYMVKVLSKKLESISIVMMLPQGYSYNYDIIFVQNHDYYKNFKNMIKIPANFAYVEPKGLYKAKKKSIGIIIGGNNKTFSISLNELKNYLDDIIEQYRGYEFAITTSPRTSIEVELLIKSYHFDYEIIFSKKNINPIPDFLDQCETIYITGDSTSMISEAISYGKANVIILPAKNQKKNKFKYFINHLANAGYIHVFGEITKNQNQNKNKKIDFHIYVDGISL